MPALSDLTHGEYARRRPDLLGRSPVRKDYEPGVLAPSQKFASELAARDAFNREHPPLKGLVVPYDLRKLELPERPWRNNRGRWFDLAGRRRIWTSDGVRDTAIFFKPARS
jgi:hypothetical protein